MAVIPLPIANDYESPSDVAQLAMLEQRAPLGCCERPKKWDGPSTSTAIRSPSFRVTNASMLYPEVSQRYSSSTWATRERERISRTTSDCSCEGCPSSLTKALRQACRNDAGSPGH